MFKSMNGRRNRLKSSAIAPPLELNQLQYNMMIQIAGLASLVSVPCAGKPTATEQSYYRLLGL